MAKITALENGLRVAEEFIEPTLELRCFAELLNDHELPLSITGYLRAENFKILSSLIWFQGMQNEITTEVNFERTSLNHATPHFNKYILTFYATLSKQAINFIEECRIRNANKTVTFIAELSFNSWMTQVGRGAKSFKSEYVRELRFKIEDSEWIRDFARKLEIGEFLLFELRIPKFLNTSSDWYNEISRSIGVLEKMKEDLISCDWNGVVEESRKLLEIFYVKDFKNPPPALQAKRDKLKLLFASSNLSDDGIQSLLNSINETFDFTSKYHHALDRKLAFNPEPHARKENAYFIFTSCVNFLHMIIAKLN